MTMYEYGKEYKCTTVFRTIAYISPSQNMVYILLTLVIYPDVPKVALLVWYA